MPRAGWLAGLVGRGPSAVSLKELLRSYPPYRTPFPGRGRSLTREQACANLDYLLAHEPERLAAVRPLLARFGLDLDAGLAAADPRPFLEALWDWSATQWPAIVDPALTRPDQWLNSRRDQDDIEYSLLMDVALVLGRMVTTRRSDYRWALDLDPDNRGDTDGDAMRSWQRPVLLRPADAVVPAIQFDLEAIVMNSYENCAKPGYRADDGMIRAVLEAVTGAHERFWRDGSGA